MQIVSINKGFIERVKMLSKKAGIPMSKLIEDCGFSKSFAHDIEGKNKTPSIGVLYVVANYFNVSTDYLLDRTNNPDVNR